MNALSRRSLFFGALATTALLGLPRPVWAQERPAKDSPEFVTWVMDRIDDMHRGSSSHAVLTMTVKTEHWTRKMSMESWSKGEKHSLVRILAPKKERGTATLKAGEDLFTYLAKTGRTIKISGAMLGGSWMGSHVTNNDLVRSSRMADDYTITLTGEGTLGGVPQYVFTLVPKPDAAVVWGKIEVTVEQARLVPTRQIFYDEDGEAVRAIEFADYKQVGDHPMAGQMVIRPLDGSGEYTQLVYDSIEFDVEVPMSTFTVQHLKSL
ncbi:MAG: outer membrane lipoprotein-sorting protein [Deltaproteobacteria bacterium]|nr:outer membrane lipoprotein-sorting protein [Deltaproteobacteria bacterium]